MPKLRIKIDGLSVMTPDKLPSGTKDKPVDKNNELTVLLIDARKAGDMQHIPKATFPDGTTWVLGGEHIDLRILRGRRNVLRKNKLHTIREKRKRHSDGKPQYKKPKADELGDFSWVPSMTEIVPGAKLDRAAFVTPDNVAKPGVVGRFKITDGKLEVDRMADGGPASPEHHIFEFEHPDSGTKFQQAAAEGMVVEIDLLNGDLVEFQARRLKDKSQPTRNVQLQVTGGADIEVAFSNQPKTPGMSHFPMLWGLLDQNLPKLPTMTRVSPNPAAHAPLVEEDAHSQIAPLHAGNSDACPFVQYP